MPIPTKSDEAEAYPNKTLAFYTPFTLQLVLPGKTSLSSDHSLMSVCESVANCPNPCVSLGSFKMYEISASDFGTMVTKGVVHGAYRVVIQSYFSVIQRHKVS